MKVLVIGGTGYIGSCLREHLCRVDLDVTYLVRRKSISKLEGAGARHVVGDLLDRGSVVRATEGIDTVVDLASIVRTLNKKKYSENLKGLENLIFAMRANGVGRLIYYSTQNVHLRNKGYYAASKIACEEVIMNSGMEHVIIRPNYVYGIDRDNDFYRMANIMKSLRLAPLIGDGTYKIQPVYKHDLAAITIELTTTRPTDSIVEVSGYETVCVREVIDLMEKLLGRKVVKVKLPVALLRPFRRFIPFDLDGYTEDKVSTESFAFPYTSFKETLPRIASLR